MMMTFMSCAKDFQTSYHTSFAQASIEISNGFLLLHFRGLTLRSAHCGLSSQLKQEPQKSTLMKLCVPRVRD